MTFARKDEITLPEKINKQARKAPVKASHATSTTSPWILPGSPPSRPAANEIEIQIIAVVISRRVS
jgi:hypothetical protein